MRSHATRSQSRSCAQPRRKHTTISSDTVSRASLSRLLLIPWYTSSSAGVSGSQSSVDGATAGPQQLRLGSNGASGCATASSSADGAVPSNDGGVLRHSR
eukprot:1518070-Prymnesium_polylepis.1